jgi:GTP cyclohydrolase I
MNYHPKRLTDLDETLQVIAGLKHDEHGSETTLRFIQSLEELTSCKSCPGDCIKWKDFEAVGDEMIVIDSIPFTSLCNHHLLPFSGFAHIAYVPDNKIAGLSKFARVVHHFSRALQLQERLTSDIADYLEQSLQPAGVAVVMRAEHLCMTIRGVRAPGTFTTTSSMRGVFSDHSRTAKAEFLQMIGDK